MNEDYYRAPQICREAGITYRQLDHWVRTGVLECAVDAEGSGTQRLFTAEQVADAKLIAGLVNVGVHLWMIRDFGPRATLDLVLEDLRKLSEELIA